jgi:hypothetical protein
MIAGDAMKNVTELMDKAMPEKQAGKKVRLLLLL